MKKKKINVNRKWILSLNKEVVGLGSLQLLLELLVWSLWIHRYVCDAVHNSKHSKRFQ